ncbi:TetR family transcriptional regulator [Kitasatospora sp. NPDC015120]|uniref:TetR family transcriptional regulator n=1 Tax=Kitasatospora sp. NPDC015120 TaxID=3364023 RepID=UPI0036F48066
MAVVRDPESKKRSLLDAALVEFAAKGIVSTRTEDIAARAGCSTGLVYTYFGSKEGLFDAVLDDIAERTAESMPITPEDLPGYAVRLYDLGIASPEIDRFIAWHQLRDGGGANLRESFERASREKVELVAAALDAGTISSRLGAGELVLAVQTIARMWATQPREITKAIGGDERSRREAVRTAVEALLGSA